MPEIRVLDQSTINQIAAGEVVERPSSIVKELVENAVDANSTAVTVEIKGGGIDFIRITDNGCGIEKEQVRKAFLPHATSKIRSASDLETVVSLGFRGEALSSIASVAKVELVTKTDEGISGIRYVIEGGEEKSYDEIGCPEGTTFIIRNLFFNTPARRKFLKSKMTEAGYVESFIQRLALSHPDISFKFICDNKNKISTSGNGNLKDVIYNIFGRDVAMNLLPVKGNENGILVDGYIGKPVISRGNRNYENYFVNGRYLKNNIISKAIEEGYKGHAMVHKFPFTALMISMDPHCFDANVHPAKMEMRFRNAEELYSSVMSAVRSSFVKKELIPKVGIGNDKKEKESVKKIPEPFERKRRAIEERFSSLSQEKIREIEKRKEQGDAAEQRVSVLAKNSMENNVRDSVQGNDGNNAQNPIQNPAQNTTGNMSGSVNGYSGVHGENSENATEISNRRSSIEERIARLHVGENNAIKKEIDDVTLLVTFLILDMMLSSKLLCCFIICYFIKINSCIFLDRIIHSQTCKRLSKVNLDTIVRNLGRTANLLCQITEHGLCQFHHSLIICICLVKLHQCEFRIVASVNTLITEYTANLINSFKSAYDQSFQIKLQRNTKLNIFIQCIVMGLKRSRSCTTGIGNQHWSFHFHEITAVKEVTDLFENLGTFNKYILAFLIHDQVYISLTITHICICQSVELLRKDLQTL